MWFVLVLTLRDYFKNEQTNITNFANIEKEFIKNIFRFTAVITNLVERNVELDREKLD